MEQVEAFIEGKMEEGKSGTLKELIDDEKFQRLSIMEKLAVIVEQTKKLEQDVKDFNSDIFEAIKTPKV